MLLLCRPSCLQPGFELSMTNAFVSNETTKYSWTGCARNKTVVFCLGVKVYFRDMSETPHHHKFHCFQSSEFQTRKQTQKQDLKNGSISGQNIKGSFPTLTTTARYFFVYVTL